MKQIAIKVGLVIVTALLPVLAIICTELINEFAFKRAFGWEGSHSYFILFLLLAFVSYISFKYFSDRLGNVTIWISLSIFIILIMTFFLYQNTIKFTIKLAPFYLTMLLGLTAGYVLTRGGSNKVRPLLFLGVLPFVFSLGVSDLWTHRIEYGNWTGNVSSSDVTPFSFEDKEGNVVDQESVQGKIVLLDFWFINCGPCWAKFPKLQEMYEKYGNSDDIRIYAVNRPMKRDKPGDLFRTIEEKGYTFPVLKGTQEDMDALGVYKYPTVMLLDRNGFIVFIGEHEGAEKKLESLLEGE